MSLLTLIRGSVLAACLAGSAAAQVKIALDTPRDLESSGTYVWAHSFSQHLKAAGFEVEEFERGALGGEDERLDQVSQGLLEVSLSDVRAAGSLDGMIMAIRLPFFFEDMAQLDHAMLDGGMLEQINRRITPFGVRVLDTVSVGSATGILNTKHPVTAISDMADLRMRALDQVQIALYEAWGTQGTIVAWDEVPNALQTGVANGYINTPIVPLLFGHTNFLSHFTDAKITLSSRVVLVSEDWYQGLSDEERDVINAAVVEARAANRNWLETQGKVIEQLRDAGIEVTTLSPEARAEFREASETVYDKVPLPEGTLSAWAAAKGN